MLRLGNDIVDLRDDESRLDALHPRFFERVFTPYERIRIRASANARLTLWSYWAAKESAYKLVVKLSPETTFSHRRFAVELADPARRNAVRGHVAYRGRRLALTVRHCSEWVSALCVLADDADRAGAVVQAVTVCGSGESPSEAVRRSAVSGIARAFRRPAASVTVAGKRPPRVLFDGKATNTELSLSHHGRWTAFAAYTPERVDAPSYEAKGGMRSPGY